MDENRDFDLVKAIIKNDSVVIEYTDWKEVEDGKSKTFEYKVKCPIIPHPDLVEVRDSFKEYLMRSHHLYDTYEEAIKYLKGDQKQKVVDRFLDIRNKITVTKIVIGGEGELKGASIFGTIESNTKSKTAINTPRIVFKSTKIGYETDVEGQCELLELEVKKLLFDNKKAQSDLFDVKPNERGEGEVIEEEVEEEA